MADLINTLTPAVNYSANELTPTGYLDATLNTIVYAHNYNDLSNKPSINGVTLKGDKTPVQLGLLTAEDIPVTSVNGQTGDVSLSGSNLMYNQNTTINEAIDNVADQIPTVPVQTVNGLTGNVVLTGNNVNYDVGESINHKIDDLAGQIVGSGVSSVNGKTGVVTLNGTDIQYDVNKTINQAIDAVAAQIPTVPVQSVNNKTGSVILTGDDIDYSEGVSVNDQITTNTTAIGDLSDLNTSDNSNLVEAVNEKATVVDLGRIDSTTKTLTFSSTVRFLIFAFGGSDGRLGGYVCFGRATTSFAQPILSAPTVTVTPNNDKIAITTSTTNIYVSLVILSGSPDDFVIT